MDKWDKYVWKKFIHRYVYKVKLKYAHGEMSINGEDYHNRCVENMKKNHKLSTSYPQNVDNAYVERKWWKNMLIFFLSVGTRC